MKKSTNIESRISSKRNVYLYNANAIVRSAAPLAIAAIRIVKLSVISNGMHIARCISEDINDILTGVYLISSALSKL